MSRWLSENKKGGSTSNFTNKCASPKRNKYTISVGWTCDLTVRPGGDPSLLHHQLTKKLMTTITSQLHRPVQILNPMVLQRAKTRSSPNKNKIWMLVVWSTFDLLIGAAVEFWKNMETIVKTQEYTLGKKKHFINVALEHKETWFWETGSWNYHLIVYISHMIKSPVTRIANLFPLVRFPFVAWQ